MFNPFKNFWIIALTIGTIIFVYALVSAKYGANSQGKLGRMLRTAAHLAIVWLMLWLSPHYGGFGSFILDFLVLLFMLVCLWMTYVNIADSLGKTGGWLDKLDEFMSDDFDKAKAYIVRGDLDGNDHAPRIRWVRRGLTASIFMVAVFGLIV